MVRDYDTQLLESVAVRRRRLRDGLLFGALRARRTLDENLVEAFVGLVIAGVLCAGCVGWSFIKQQRALQKKQQAGIAAPVSAESAGPTGRPDWRGKQVTSKMLGESLRRAGVSDGLYVLPGTSAKSGAESYYFVAQRSGQYVDGAYEARVAAFGAVHHGPSIFVQLPPLPGR